MCLLFAFIIYISIEIFKIYENRKNKKISMKPLLLKEQEIILLSLNIYFYIFYNSRLREIKDYLIINKEDFFSGEMSQEEFNRFLFKKFEYSHDTFHGLNKFFKTKYDSYPNHTEYTMNIIKSELVDKLNSIKKEDNIVIKEIYYQDMILILDNKLDYDTGSMENGMMEVISDITNINSNYNLEYEKQN